jgi:formamidopyrimidine-DNA glycosylase
MPELPEVEMRRRFVETHALKRVISTIDVSAPKILSGVSVAVLRGALEGRRFDVAHRHGKWLFVRAAADTWLVLHFGMTGSLAYVKTKTVAIDHVRLRLDFTNGHSLAFIDPRMFGEVSLASSPHTFLENRGWGPDPTLPGFDRAVFHQRLQRRTGVLKTVLMNQQVIAGIGNLYADEMLFQTGLHPSVRVSALKPATLDKLYDAMMEIFTASLAVDTDFERLPDHFLLRHRNYSGRCPKCGEALAQSKSAGRTGYHCPRHQRRRS